MVTYKEAGVDIQQGAQFAEAIRGLMKRTFDGRVIGPPGGFAALFSVDFDEKLWRRDYRHPVLVSSTDGVGTKLKVAFMSGRHDTVGIDLVAMCVNDVLALGAEPMFLLDYLATGRLEPETLYQVVKGISDGCRQCDCALLGGETAEMPDFYPDGEYDMAGFVVGLADRHKLITGRKIEPGDSVIGLPSSGLHSNGFSLARKLIFEQEGLKPEDSLRRFGLERTVADELLEPTRIYVRPVRNVLAHYRVKQVVHGIAHITGGGLLGNLRRILPAGCAVEIAPERWERPRIFDVLQGLGSIPEAEMYGTFNMGIGLVLVVSAYYGQSILAKLRREGEEAVLMGCVVRGEREVRIV